METVNLVATMVVVAGLLFFFIYSALALVVLWRFSFSRLVSLAISVVFAVAAVVLVAQSLFALSQI